MKPSERTTTIHRRTHRGISARRNLVPGRAARVPSVWVPGRAWLGKRPWLWLASMQVLFLLFFYRPHVFRVDGERIWATCDDMYVSACYARNLAQGHGLVWYPGAPKVEGISNPLWTMLLALVHGLPFFDEAALGLYLIAMNAICLVLLYMIFWRALCQVLAHTEPGPERRDARLRVVGPGAWLVAAVGLLPFSMPYWMSNGFSIGLVAVLSLAGFVLALRKERCVARCVAIGVLMGAAFWTRMDGVVFFSGALLLTALTGRRRLWSLCIQLGVAGMIIALLFLVRWTYYGEWLPNTYYLKLHGWLLRDRIARGLGQNWPVFPTVVLAWLALALPQVRQRLGAATAPTLAAMATFTVSVLYSTHNGGDAWGLVLGFDRFTATGSVFLMLALAVGVAKLHGRSGRRVVAFAGACLLALTPLALAPGLGQLKHALLASFPLPGLSAPRLEQSWVANGKAFEQVSIPGARIAVGAAGAVIYFSHRGGVDLLGKCEPFVAHMTVRHYKGAPGHNKRDDAKVFRLRNPDFSILRPPAGMEHLYVRILFPEKDKHFWARRQSPYVRWHRVTVVEKKARPVTQQR